MLEAPKPITIKVAKMSMPDPVPGYIREFNEQAERDEKRQAEISILADHYFTSGFSFGDFMEALEECDQENRKRLMDLMRIKDDAAVGLQVRQIFEAYCWRFAEGEV